MKKFIARCTALPVVDDAEDCAGYAIGRFYLFEVFPASGWIEEKWCTTGDDGVPHAMCVDYFTKYFARVFTDKDGYYYEL